MQFDLYTEEYFFSGKLKKAVKKMLGSYLRGPQSVALNLQAGLAEIGANFRFNQKPQASVAAVLNGTNALAWAIAQKKAGKFQKIAAGPNIVVLPQDSNGILTNPLIDAIIVPAEWVKNAYEKNAPELTGKIFVWPVGVSLPELDNITKDIDFLIFDKLGDKTLSLEITRHLKVQNKKICYIEYGKFRPQDYPKLLKHAKAMVYLGKTESQGIAMFEAWAANVPTFVLGQDDTASPYLTSQSGMLFGTAEDFKNKLPQFLSTSFSPRKYIEENFTLAKSAQAYLNIIQSL